MTNAERFLGRADAYAAARPCYPDTLGVWLRELDLLSGGVADLGAGTGLFTRLLLVHGARMDAVEPNPEMRAALAAELRDALAAGKLHVHAGKSEATGLPAASVRLVTLAYGTHAYLGRPCGHGE